jgi:hypothetical protein
MKVIKVGSNAQTRIAQAWYAVYTELAMVSEHCTNSMLVIGVDQRRYDAMELDRMFKDSSPNH